VWQRLVKMGNAPRAMLFSKPIDSLAAGGLIVADIWAGKRIVVVDRLGDDFLATVTHGDVVAVRENGEITIIRKPPVMSDG
jgi:predicted aconitase with swiveling domain